MEILNPRQYQEYEEFVSHHPRSEITQSTKWHKVKSNWDNAVVVSRDAQGKIIGGASVLIRKVSFPPTALLYCPRGPVCDPYDKEVLADLKKGFDLLAKKHRAYSFKMDPDILESDERFFSLVTGMGFTQFLGEGGFETIQARFNYRLYLDGRSEDEVFAALTQKTRYNIRVAMKHKVTAKPVGKEYLDDFVRLMQTTGERDGFTVRPRSYFEKMLDALGKNVRLYMAFYEGQPVSGAITSNYGGKTCYIYGASDNAHRNVMPNYLIQWEMIRWAIQTGCSVYDFQGVSGNLTEEDHLYGLYRFKKGFNGTLDALAGEFDYFYRPTMAKLVDKAIDLNETLRGLRRKLSK
ncbi:peptidoglycan bridge formation glycyltransferase FemA/FemB family protein [Oscillospiraceae bacterium MB08-C2-2]|nr:peptidoglycan bridge formation glycyltransferase FemA/FemB family protein [Oscillospiraceae bacterium MB08-C2-2]